MDCSPIDAMTAPSRAGDSCCARPSPCCCLSWLFSQTLALPLLVHERCRALQAMDRSRQLVHRNGLKVLALLGMLLGLNVLGLIGATLGLLLSLPFSALVLMACCRPQTPLISDSRLNMFPT